MDIAQAILSTFVIQAAAEYYVPERTSKWKDAEGTCNMAVPDLHPTRDGFKVNIDNNLINSNVWLGLFMKMTVFDYIGCVKLENQMYDRHVQSNSPGLCYTFCKENEMIGVSIDKCICVNTLGNYSKHETHCTTPCGSRPEGVACGGNGYMSVYKVNKNVSTGGRETPCLSFERYDKSTFNWRKCSLYMRVVCANELSVTDSHSWLDSMNECFKMGSFPKSYQALTEINSQIIPFWSGVISSGVIYNYTEWNGNFQGVRFGYVSANNSVYFTNKDEHRLVLCNRTHSEQATTLSPFGTSSTSSATNTAVKIESTSIRKNHSVQDPTISPFGTSLTSSATNTAVTIESTSTKKGQDVSVIIGVSVSVCVVIIAVGAVLIILRRRGKLLSLPCSSGQDVVIKDKVNKTSTVIKDSPSETVNSEQDHYTALSQTEYINDSHTYSGLELSNSDHNAFGHERNLSLENGNIYYNDIISEKT